MAYTYKITTLNINGISASTRIHILEDYLYKHDMLQEATNPKITTIQRYTQYINVGTEGRGAAILFKGCYLITNIQRIPTGRGISAHFNGIRIIKTYAPARSEKKRECEDFYNGGVASILINSSDNMILAGDFNCVLTTSDCTCSLNVSRALAILVTGLDLVDGWDVTQGQTIYTHYRAQGASQIDSIYLSCQLLKTKQGQETVAAALTDHLATIASSPFCPLHVAS